MSVGVSRVTVRVTVRDRYFFLVYSYVLFLLGLLISFFVWLLYV